MKTDFKKIARQRRETLARHGGDPIRASIEHHERRLREAVDRKDYSTMRDAERALADLRARL